MNEEAVLLLREIRNILRRREEEAPQSIPLEDFCKRLGRDIRWGYRMVQEKRIIPDKSGRPYRVGLGQLQNFQ